MPFTGLGMIIGYGEGKLPHPMGSEDPDFGYEYIHDGMGYDMSTDQPIKSQVTNATAYFEIRPGN